MTYPFDVRRPLAAITIAAMIAIAGCAKAPEPPRTAGSKPETPAGHDDDRGGHDHAATDEDHDHHDHDHDHDHANQEPPRSLSEGVGRLSTLAASVKRHLAVEAHGDADAAVHDLGHVLEDLQGLVRTSDLAVDAKAAATKALDELFECFDALDASLHAEPGKSEPPAEVHAAVAKRIAAGIESFRAACTAKAAAVEDDAAAIIRDAEAGKRREQE